MCWIGPVKIAEKDIIVYKLGYLFKNSGVFSSLYHGYDYHPKGLNRTVTLAPIVGGAVLPHLSQFDTGLIYSGYHSYKSICLLFNEIYTFARTILLGNIRDRINLYNDYYVATFIIPKGSQYAINWKGEIISNQIMYTGKHLKL